MTVSFSFRSVKKNCICLCMIQTFFVSLHHEKEIKATISFRRSLKFHSCNKGRSAPRRQSDERFAFLLQ